MTHSGVNELCLFTLRCEKKQVQSIDFSISNEIVQLFSLKALIYRYIYFLKRNLSPVVCVCVCSRSECVFVSRVLLTFGPESYRNREKEKRLFIKFLCKLVFVHKLLKFQNVILSFWFPKGATFWNEINSFFLLIQKEYKRW